MANENLKNALKADKITYWQIADELNCHENTIMRMFRHELSAADTAVIEQAASKIRQKRGDTHAE